jgi:hypothetical protein
MYEITNGLSGGKISDDEFASLRDDEKAAAIRKIHEQMLLNVQADGQIGRFVSPYLASGHCRPNQIALVYTFRYDYFTPICLLADQDSEVLCFVTDVEKLAERCDRFTFSPESSAAKYWKSKYPKVVQPAVGDLLYQHVATDLRSLDLKENEFVVAFFTHAQGSVFPVEVKLEELARLRQQPEEIEPRVINEEDSSFERSLPMPQESRTLEHSLMDSATIRPPLLTEQSVS